MEPPSQGPHSLFLLKEPPFWDDWTQTFKVSWPFLLCPLGLHVVTYDRNLTTLTWTIRVCFSLIKRSQVVGKPGLVPLVKRTRCFCLLVLLPLASSFYSYGHKMIAAPTGLHLPSGRRKSEKHWHRLAESKTVPPASPFQQTGTYSLLARSCHMATYCCKEGWGSGYFNRAHCCTEQTISKEEGEIGSPGN